MRWIATLWLLLATSLVWAEESSSECERFQHAVASRPGLDAAARKELLASRTVAWEFVWENDALAGGGDRQYSNGLALSWTFNPCRRDLDWLKSGFRSALAVLDRSGDGQWRHSYSVGGVWGMTMYTPSDISQTDRQRDDRPYAGWQYGGIRVTRQGQRSSVRGTAGHLLELQAGVVGPAAHQDDLQAWTHHVLFPDNKPKGWDNQISNQFGFNLLYLYRRNWFPWAERDLRVTPVIGFSAGNVISYVSFGGIVAIGDTDDELPPAATLPSISNTQPLGIAAGKKPGVMGLMGLDYRRVFSNLFVEGHGESAHDIVLVPDVCDAFVGVSFTPQSGRHRMTFKVIHRTREFSSANPANETPYRFGQLTWEW